MTKPGQVGRQARRGLAWSLAGSIATNAMRVVVIAVLGRALTSTDFGIVAAALSVNVILHGIRDVGIGRALVQRKELEDRHIRTSFAVSTYLGFVITGILLLGAPRIGAFFNISGSVDVIRALAILYAIRGLASTSRMLCERDMRFTAVALIDAGTFMLGSTVAIVAAVSGAGPWSLVLGYLAEEGLSALLYMIVKPPKVSLVIDGPSLRELMSFGIGQTLTQITGMGATYGDNIVVGHALGATLLGFYTRAYDLIKMPSFIFEAVVGKVLFSAFSRIQDERDRLATAFRRIMFLNALVLLPASALAIVMAPEVIRLMVGAGWESSILPLQILGLTILPRTSQKVGTIIAQAAGRSNAMALAHGLYMVNVVGGAILSIRWGIIGVSITTSIAIFIVFAHCTFLGMQVTGLSLGALLKSHIPGAVLAAVVVVVATVVAMLVRDAGLAAPLRLGLVAAASIAVCLVGVGLGLRRNISDFAWLRTEIDNVVRRKRPQIA